VTSSTQITATAQGHAAGTIDVVVQTPGGYSSTSSADHFTYLGAPTVVGLSPTSGTSAGGTSVTVGGTNFSFVSVVYFGGTAATSFTVNSSTQITATSPAHATGTVDVTVQTPGGTSATSSADHYTYT
jgi:hypothetical protein